MSGSSDGLPNGHSLRVAREKFGLETPALAAILRVSPRQLLGWERLDAALPPDVADRLEQLDNLGPHWADVLGPPTKVERVFADNLLVRFRHGGPLAFVLSLGVLVLGLFLLVESSYAPSWATAWAAAVAVAIGSLGLLVSFSSREAILCSECHRRVSWSDTKCPHCYQPLDERTPNRRRLIR